jgi:ABC-type sugar transport system ATPase subunit
VAELFSLVQNLRASGTAIIFISHRLEELFEIADRVTVLRDGYYIDTCDIKETSRDDLLRKMVGRTISEQYPKVEVQPGEVLLKVEHITSDGLFQDISFELRRGEILGLAGLVGAGRTHVAESLVWHQADCEGKDHD